MQTQLQAVRSDHSKGKSSRNVSAAADELLHLMDFNARISQAMAKTMEHLSDFVFVFNKLFMANLTLASQDSYLYHLKTGIKPNTLAALIAAPLQMATLFPDNILKQAKEDIAIFESKGQTHSSEKGRYHPYERETGYPQSPTHSRLTENGSSQAIQARPAHPDRVVHPSSGFSINMQQVAPTSDRSICHEVRLPTSSSLGKSGGEVVGLSMQKNHSDCSRVAMSSNCPLGRVLVYKNLIYLLYLQIYMYILVIKIIQEFLLLVGEVKVLI